MARVNIRCRCTTVLTSYVTPGTLVWNFRKFSTLTFTVYEFVRPRFSNIIPKKPWIRPDMIPSRPVIRERVLVKLIAPYILRGTWFVRPFSKRVRPPFDGKLRFPKNIGHGGVFPPRIGFHYPSKMSPVTFRQGARTIMGANAGDYAGAFSTAAARRNVVGPLRLPDVLHVSAARRRPSGLRPASPVNGRSGTAGTENVVSNHN